MKETPIPLHLIKFGGSLITDKSTYATPRPSVIRNLLRQLSTVTPLPPLLLFHGAGSFGHTLAAQGLPQHARQIQSDLQHLSQLIVDAGQPLPLPLHAVHPHQHATQLHSPQWWQSLLDSPTLPLLHGDVVDGTILSTEPLLHLALTHLPRPARILLLTQTAGILDPHGQTIPDGHTVPDTVFHQSPTPDVSGAMSGKHHHALTLCQQFRAQVTIASGTPPHLLRDWLAGRFVQGTHYFPPIPETKS